MIKKSMPLTLPEAAEIAGDTEKENNIKSFAKQFVKLNAKDARAIKEELAQLDLIKLKEIGIAKIIDFMPQDVTDLIKILPGVSLNKDEVDKILAIVKKHW